MQRYYFFLYPLKIGFSLHLSFYPYHLLLIQKKMVSLQNGIFEANFSGFFVGALCGV